MAFHGIQRSSALARWFSVGTLCLALTSFTGCSDSAIAAATPAESEGGDGSTARSMSPGPLPDFLAVSVGSRERLPFRGVRVVKQFEIDSDGLRQALEIREEVGSDGEGGYTIELVEAINLPAGTDDLLYEVTHRRSVDVFWSKRDFHIQDLDLAASNYSIIHLPETSSVAGIVCEQVEFARYSVAEARPGRYVVDFDATTGFVLGWAEFDNTGEPLASSVYETFTYRPTLSDLALGGAKFQGSLLDLNGPLSDQAGFPVFVPDLLPMGYDVFEIETFDVPAAFVDTGNSYLPAGSWVRMHATDGIESLSFAHADAASAPSGRGDDQLRVLRQGSWDFGFGRVSGVPFVVAGRVSTTALRRLVESAVR